MKRLVTSVTLVVALTRLLLLGLTDVSASIADTSIPDNEIASSASEAETCDSTSARITITWRTAPLPGE